MSDKLPDGFRRVPTSKNPAITFDPKNKRFYLSVSLRHELKINTGVKVGLAFNRATRQILIDFEGRSFYVDKRGYISSTQFIDRSYGASAADLGTLKYVKSDEDYGSTQFAVFDEVDSD